MAQEDPIEVRLILEEALAGARFQSDLDGLDRAWLAPKCERPPLLFAMQRYSLVDAVQGAIAVTAYGGPPVSTHAATLGGLVTGPEVMVTPAARSAIRSSGGGFAAMGYKRTIEDAEAPAGLADRILAAQHDMDEDWEANGGASFGVALEVVQTKFAAMDALLQSREAIKTADSESVGAIRACREDIARRLARLPSCETTRDLMSEKHGSHQAYYEAFGTMLNGAVRTPRPLKRVVRPTPDCLNSVLSYGYVILHTEVTGAVLARGLDTAFSVLFSPRMAKRDSLALDLMEPLRHLIIDPLVLSLFNLHSLTPRHFYQAGRAVKLSPEGKDIFFEAFHKCMDRPRGGDGAHRTTRSLIDLAVQWHLEQLGVEPTAPALGRKKRSLLPTAA